MICPICERPMLALFTSWVCDHCDGPPEGDFYRGWAVWPDDQQDVATTLVFRTPEHARRWKDGREGTVRPVLAESPYVWRRSSGTMKGLELAEKPFEIYPDHRHPPGPHRAFIAPIDLPDADLVHLERGPGGELRAIA